MTAKSAAAQGVHMDIPKILKGTKRYLAIHGYTLVGLLPAAILKLRASQEKIGFVLHICFALLSIVCFKYSLRTKPSSYSGDIAIHIVYDATHFILKPLSFLRQRGITVHVSEGGDAVILSPPCSSAVLQNETICTPFNVVIHICVAYQKRAKL